MKSNELFEAARVIFKRNAGSGVFAASAAWLTENLSLQVEFFFDGEPTHDDEEDCEISVAELIAEFPSIAEVSVEFRSASSLSREHAEVIAYLREGPHSSL